MTLGEIKIETVNSIYRLTIDAVYFPDDRMDQLEAEGETLSEALMNLHAIVEAIES